MGSKATHKAIRLGGAAVAVLAGAALMAAPASAGFLDGCTTPQATLYASAGLAQGFGSMYCASNVKSMELEVDLYEHWTSDNAWHFMPPARTVGPRSPGSGSTIGTQSPATVPCKDSSQRQWKVYVTGYAEIGNTWFADQTVAQETLPCRG